MYLKSIELVGFKSFAEKTKLAFEPGMTAIVGPNGCGKSNVSDAVRWVLGEQSAKAVRGSKMEDCIFSGTDDRKPLGMAEVSLTLADCEGVLDTEYHEVTVTRRVFRSGEGQYFINKNPCRLKDIQRLFMDTGIGTTSYSLMEQGRIDRVLSSRPEDRRAVFEEASGITKFKTDKKEAIRKLEQTDANLLRLADVIREVKRQIGSLQRQAGKARRFKECRDELRKFDVFVSQTRLRAAARDIRKVEEESATMAAEIQAAQADVHEMEAGNNVLREGLMNTEREIAVHHEAAAQARSRLDHTNELIRLNGQRIAEFQSLSQRNSAEVEATLRQIDDRKAALRELATRLGHARSDRDRADAEMTACQHEFEQYRARMDQTRIGIQKLREESVQMESLISALQNQFLEIETRERSAVIQRERLAAEKAQLTRIAAGFDQRQSNMAARLAQFRVDAEQRAADLKAMEERRACAARRLREEEEQASRLESSASACRGQIDILRQSTDAREGFAEGARILLDPAGRLDVNRDEILGALAAHVTTEPGYRLALEAALRAWLDAVVVRGNAAALEIVRQLEEKKVGAARIVAVEPCAAPPDSHDSAAGQRLMDNVRCSPELRPVLERLIGNVWLADSLSAVPSSVPADTAYVTPSGSLVRDGGCMEFWMADSGAATPLARRHLLADAEAALAQIQGRLDRLREDIRERTAEVADLATAVDEARDRLSEARTALAQREGECQVVAAEAEQARQRLETVTWEIENLRAQGESGAEEKRNVATQLTDLRARREAVVTETASRVEELREVEARHSESQTRLTDHRVRFTSLSHQCENLENQESSAQTRLAELTSLLDGHHQDIRSYGARIEELQRSVSEARSTLSTLAREAEELDGRIENLRKNRMKQAGELQELDRDLERKREALDASRAARGSLDVRLAESRLRRQNQIDRVTAEYSLTYEQLMDQPEPTWEGGRPSLDELETRIAELRTKIEAMGPVNLVAIEEYQELEERCAFLTAQEDDLTRAKTELMEMIRKINRTTTEMFSQTFNQVNENFDCMFRKLFNGGTAKLVLVNEEDILECGIEIIARPPGKRLQNISLLSGGERTLTAVALLFAIYMIKPSPFCVLDELDAPLDDSNIGRFVDLLQDFLRVSQFLIITHNQKTIAKADILYGVTMPEKGISKIVSMRFRGRGDSETRNPLEVETGNESTARRRRAAQPAAPPEPVPSSVSDVPATGSEASADGAPQHEEQPALAQG